MALNFLSQEDAGLAAGFAHVGGPDGGLDFADVGFAQQEHAQAGLADTAADGLGQFSVQQEPMEIECFFVQLAAFCQLAVQGLRIHADTHTGDLEGAFQHRIPQQDIAVEGPVVVVRGAAVVGLSVGEFVTDTLYKNGPILLCNGVFTFFGPRLSRLYSFILSSALSLNSSTS